MTRHASNRARSPAEIQAEQTAPLRIQQAKIAMSNIQIPGCAIVGAPSDSGIFTQSIPGTRVGPGKVFDTTYPNTLSGVISCEEFTASIERINAAGKMTGVYLGKLLGLATTASLCFFIVAIVMSSTTHDHPVLFTMSVPVGLGGAVFFSTVGRAYLRYKSRKSGERQWHAISAENDFYTSSQRSVPCTWKLQAYRGTAQVLFCGSFTQLEISSGAGFGSSIDEVAASCGFEAIDDLGLPRNTQCGVVVPGAPLVTATTALVPGQGYGYGYGYGTMAPTAPLAIPQPQGHPPVVIDGTKAPMLPPSYSDSWQDPSASASAPAPILLTTPNYKAIPAACAAAPAPTPTLTNTSSDPDSSSHSVTIPISVALANPSTDSLVCAQCSKQLPRDSIFCSQCGARVAF